MGNTLYRAINESPVQIVGGYNHLLWTKDGCLVDLSSGPCASSLGHSNREVTEAIMSQMKEVPFVFSGYWSSAASERAGEILAREFEAVKPGWFGKVIFQSGGGEAVDLACKLSFQYHLEAGDKHRILFAAREHCFHGVGLLPFALTGDYPRYAMIEPYHKPVRDMYLQRIPHPFTDGVCVQPYLSSSMAAVIIEPVGGPPIGCHPDTKEYLQDLRRVCDENGILLIFDEILCGSGRCGALSTAMLYDVWPDIILLGKGLTSGYQPVSAICVSNRVIERIAKGSGTLSFGTTYAAHSMGCAAVHATLKYIRDNDLYQRVQTKSTVLRDMILACGNPAIHAVRGMGYLWGIELVNPETGKPFPAEIGFHAKARKAIMDLGVVTYSKGQTVYGERDFLVIAPPFEIPSTILRDAVKRVMEGINVAVKSVVEARV